MFRKPNRNLRVRRAESGEDEEEKEDSSLVERPRRPGGRGLTCGTKKRRKQADIEKTDIDETDVGETNSRTAGLLSFNQEREDEEVTFKIKKPSVNAVVFKVQKKTENVDVHSRSPENDSQDGSQSIQEDSEPEDLEFKKEESPGSSSTSTSPSASPSQPSHAGEIPDSKQIWAARRQRKLARAKGDFMSLHVSDEDSDSTHSESDDEQDDHERRIKFAPGVKTLNEQMAEEMASSSESSSEKEDDDDRWEEQQIRKAVKYPQAVSEHMLRGDSPPPVKRHVELKLPPVTMEDIKRKLTTRLASIEEVHRSHLLDNEKYTRNLEDSKNALEKLEKSLNEQSFTFFKKMKIYVENFVDCLNEKILQINELEAEMFQILEERAKMILKRRQDDLRNESAAVQKPSALAGNGVASELETSDDKVERQVQDCELRRRKRWRRREESGEEDHYEGMSSDDELPVDLENNLQKNRENILAQCRTIFDDVHEDFCRVKNVLCKFHEWRTRFPDSYYDAYISLCLHKILNPLVRLQLIGWNPLEDVTDLDQMPWYCDLEEFCFTKEEHENNVEEHADHKVLSAVIEKTVVPRVSGFIEHVWDPLSSQQTERLVCFCKTYVLENESSRMVKDLIACLVSRLRKAIEDDVYIPLYPKSVLEDRNSPRFKFRERQFWSAVKLLGNVARWDGFLEEETLQELSLDKLLNRYLLLVLLNAEPNRDMVTKCTKIVECLPQSWFKGIESGSSLAKLGNFSRHLEQCIHALHKQNDRESMERLTSLLMKIKAQNSAEEVMKKYSIALRAVT